MSAAAAAAGAGEEEVELPEELQDQEDECSCWVCFGLFKDPVTLHCAHSFCRGCALDVAKSQTGSDTAPCPFCRRAFELPLPETDRAVQARVAAFEAALALFRSGGKASSDGGDGAGDSGAGGDSGGGDSVPVSVEDGDQPDAPILWLPREVLGEVLSYLPPKEVGRASFVCRGFRQSADSPLLWRSICLDRFPFCSVDKYGKNWKRAFAARQSVTAGWEGGKAGDFKMHPLRAHKAYVSDFTLFRSRVASASADGTVKLWKADSKSPLGTLSGHDAPVHTVSFTSQGVASGAGDGTLRLWDARSATQTGCAMACGGSTSTEIGTRKGVLAVQMIAGGGAVTGGSDARVKLWDERAGLGSSTHTFAHSGGDAIEQVLLLGPAPFDRDDNASAAAAGVSGSTVVVARDAGGNVKVWDARAARVLHDLANMPAAPGATNVVPAASVFAPAAGGASLVLGCRDGRTFVADAATGVAAPLAGARHYAAITDIKCDGTHAVSTADDGSVKSWDVRPGRRRLQHTFDGHKGGAAHSVQFASLAPASDDPAANAGKVVTSGADNTIRVWNLGTGQQMYALLGGSTARRRAGAADAEHPTKPGASQVAFDDSRIVGVFGAMLRVYDFDAA